jgi:hypothetical protein
MTPLPLFSCLSTYRSRVAATTLRTSLALLPTGYGSLGAEMVAVLVRTVPTGTLSAMWAVT